MPLLGRSRRRRALGFVGLAGVAQREKPGPAPGRAGDGAGDCRQTGVGGPLPVKPLARDRDGVTLPAILANQHRPGLEVAAAPATLSRQAVQEPQAVAIEAAERALLQVPSDHAAKEVLAQTCRGYASE